MSRNVLQMKYHAAKREISFKRFQDGREIAIKSGGALSKYVNLRGKFVLQDFGNTFFGDIAKVFHGIRKVEIEAIMTKLDYEDLELMIENYNQEPKSECTFFPTLLAELPDMKTTYEEVKKFGESAIGILGMHRSKLFDLPLDSDNIRESVESFAKQIDEEIKNIKDKIDSLSDNRVSLCFTGVYSAGKSALINALLGYKILPESIKSETAKMFRIYSPDKGDKEKIIFELCNVYTVLQWNDNEGVLEFKKGPSENEIRTEIQNLLNEGKEQGKRKDEQIKCLLDKLNGYEEVSSEIRVEFPVPLDRDTVQFTIYDTPGTDSNDAAHRHVLREALENQTQSILIFVMNPDRLEGEGNSALLNYLKEAENKKSKTSIDISRSLFVINKSDQCDDDEREELQHGKIKDQKDDKFTIKLEDKKLFFTSALYGYAAKAVKNGTASQQEQAFLMGGKTILATEGFPMSHCYRENRCASSEVATKSMIDRCEKALETAMKENNDVGVVEVCSGLFALETEILQYGEKYASAVKAFAIIDSVNKALAKLNNQAGCLRESNQKEIASIEKDIKELENTINSVIEAEYQSRTIPKGKAIPEAIRKRLKIDSKTLNDSLVGKTEIYLDKTLKGRFFGLGKVKFKETDKTKIKDGISDIISEFTDGFLVERESLLKKERDEFIKAVKQAIMKNGNISEAAKKFFQDIPKSTISQNKGITNLDGIYSFNKRTEKMLFLFKKEHLYKELFIADIKDKLQSIAIDMANEYARDYQRALETILMAVKSNFAQNLAKYSLYDNREVMKQLGEKIEEAANDLIECEDDLNSIIWKLDSQAGCLRDSNQEEIASIEKAIPEEIRKKLKIDSKSLNDSLLDNTEIYLDKKQKGEFFGRRQVMSRNVLQMKYHAAKKEISFKRFQDGTEIAIKSGGALSKYVNMRGKFVLQDFGNTFFGDIAKVFHGIRKVEIEAIMTKLDYEDLELMIENYNQEPKSECTFFPTLLAELPDMKTTYEEVKKFGESAIGILGMHRSKLFDLPLDSDNIRESVESFAKQIDEEIKNIKDKIDSLSDNRVSLCFTGVYSAGKSALINALLGYKILPESIKSETAKMFRIYSPDKGDKEKIIFELCNVYTVLQWNDNEGVLEFKKGPSENEIRTEIQNLLNEGKEQGKRKDEQIKCLLDKLNGYEEVSSEIRVEFPVPLDRDTVQFTIYDTPGTDSNDAAHRHVLREALENQTQSILIFVARADGLEGEGNNALLNYLKEAESKHSKTSIDMSRSLFVMNKADSLTADARRVLQHREIKDQKDDEFTIKLEDKKLFFTSALYGYAAKAVKNDTASQQEQAFLMAGKMNLATEGFPMSHCYRENRCASSEVATKSMIDRCEKALETAMKENNDVGVVEVCSGLFALETEILQYGEKYASAVKAFAIIDSVNKALTKLTNQAGCLRESNQKEIKSIENDIKELRNTINRAIEVEYQFRTIPKGKAIPDEIRKRLKIDSKTLNDSLVGETERYLDKTLKGRFLGLGKVKFKETDKTKIKDGISDIISKFTDGFLAEREVLLKKERDEFVEAVKQAIMENGTISEAAKRFFQDIPKPKISRSKGITNLDSIYNSNKRTETMLYLFKREYLDKKSFIDDIKDKLQSIATNMANEYASDYQKALETILMAVKSKFGQNLDTYSLYMKALIDNREVMKQLGEKVEEAANDLIACEDDLNAIIWKEK